jgi:hypothetical protein
MKNKMLVLALIGPVFVLALVCQAQAQESGAQVHVVITDMSLRAESALPPLTQDQVTVRQGKTPLKVTQLIPAGGDNAALQLMILIDDTLTSEVNNNLNDIRSFVQSQPPSTVIGVGYMSNAGVNVVQNFTADHDLAAKAIRLPRGATSTMDSPYLSLISLVKNWPPQNVRRVVLMVSDGIDRLRGEKPKPSQLGPRYGPAPIYHSMPTISVDATSASDISQRYNVLVYTIYAKGIAQTGRSSWDLQTGLSGLTKISDETGGQNYSLGTSSLVSFKPYLDKLQKLLSNQYYLVFLATPRKKAGFQRVNIRTEVANSKIVAPDNVWVRAAE